MDVFDLIVEDTDSPNLTLTNPNLTPDITDHIDTTLGYRNIS